MFENNIELFCLPEMLEKFERSFKINYKKNNELEVLTIKNGIIHPLELSETQERENKQFGGVTDENLKFIDFSLQKRYEEDSATLAKNWYIGAKPDLKIENIKFIDEDIVFIGPIKRHFAHFYLETLSRAWFFLNENNLKYKIAYLVQDEDEPKWDLVEEFFTLLDVKLGNLIKIKEPTKFKNVIIPEQAYELQHCYHPVYKQTIDKLKYNIVPKKYKKVYFSKKFNYPGYLRTIGDDISEELFKRNGYKVFYPEKMTLKETLSVLKGCEEFVAASGSNAHNAIFLNDGVKIVILNRSEHVHPTQTMIDKMKNLKSIYIDSFYNLLPVNWSIGPFSFCYTECLEDYLNKYHMKFNKKKLQKKHIKNLSLYLGSWAEFYSTPEIFSLLNVNEILVNDLIKHIKNANLLNKKRGNIFLKIKRKVGQIIHTNGRK